MSGNTTTSKLGGNVPGFQPTLLGGGANGNSGSGMVGGGERGVDRMFLRRGTGRSTWFFKATNTIPTPGAGYKTTPFRVAVNAGDLAGTTNSGPLPQLPSANQVNGPMVNTQQNKGDGIKSGSAGFTGNPKYVYDSSDYTKFKKLQAKLKTYNDSSFGGSNNGSYSFLMRVRR